MNKMYNRGILMFLTYNLRNFSLKPFSQIVKDQKILLPAEKIKKWKKDGVLRYLQSIKSKLDFEDVDFTRKQKISATPIDSENYYLWRFKLYVLVNDLEMAILIYTQGLKNGIIFKKMLIHKIVRMILQKLNNPYTTIN